MPEPTSENSSLRPEDIAVETFSQLPPGFHAVDEDPTDPAYGYYFDVPLPDGRTAHV
jgi:hypothetical protein